MWVGSSDEFLCRELTMALINSPMEGICWPSKSYQLTLGLENKMLDTFSSLPWRRQQQNGCVRWERLRFGILQEVGMPFRSIQCFSCDPSERKSGSNLVFEFSLVVGVIQQWLYWNYIEVIGRGYPRMAINLVASSASRWLWVIRRPQVTMTEQGCGRANSAVALQENAYHVLRSEDIISEVSVNVE